MHHGCWAAATTISAGTPPRHVAFMSLRSPDRASNAAAHTRTSTADTGAFPPELRLPGDAVPWAQHVLAAPIEDPESIDVTAGWAALRQTHDATSAPLATRAAASGAARWPGAPARRHPRGTQCRRLLTAVLSCGQPPTLCSAIRSGGAGPAARGG
ncbi:hypothetical protein DEJ33_09505 [Curtobacterium sp. MCPF17_047]|nr:hypothetical protein DEJ24_00085 [Curtobacterium sp. MCPF17_001]PZF65508.1 hypothetical protein DEJ33_09505 [Curtobacterium sp. MCPF17_047]